MSNGITIPAIGALSSSGSSVYAGGFGTVYVSTNDGANWTSGTGIPAFTSASNVYVDGATLWAGTGDGVYRSTDDGASWTLVNDGLGNLIISALLSPDGTHLFAAGAGGVFLSADDGDHWTSVGTGLTSGVRALALSVDGSTLLAATSGFGFQYAVTGHPVATLPVGLSAEGLPIGIQVIGKRWSDPGFLRILKRLAQTSGCRAALPEAPSLRSDRG